MKSLDLVTVKGQDVWFDSENGLLKIETGCGFKDELDLNSVKELYLFLKDSFYCADWEEENVRS